MANALTWYLRREVVSRKGSILSGGGFWLAILVGALLGRWGSAIIPGTTTVGSLAVALLTYAAIALGFSLAGLTLTLTLPNADFVELLCGTKPPKRLHDSYSDLLFVFSWTAITHWFLVVVSIILVLLVNPSQVAFESGHHRIKAGLVSGLAAYCLFQFLITLITLSQVGSVYIAHLQRKLQPKQSAERAAFKQAE